MHSIESRNRVRGLGVSNKLRISWVVRIGKHVQTTAVAAAAFVR